MLEFGSDFHYIELGKISNGKTIHDVFPSANYYADGRQALIHLYQSKGWERLWIPEYYCPDVIASLETAGLVLSTYTDYPGWSDDTRSLQAIQKKGYSRSNHAILRVNYFGMRSRRSFMGLNGAVIIEDHTHDLLGEWARYSQADWCIASLRKTLPIPEGGILWSPKQLQLPESSKSSDENENVAAIRWKAMRLKARYLAGENVDKKSFRSGFLDTEGFFDTASVCSLDQMSHDYLASFDVADWYRRKRDNWEILRSIKKEGVSVLTPESKGCYPFSLILRFDSFEKRDMAKKALIDNNIYPAILWSINPTINGEVYEFAKEMLSIHCDGRYSPEETLRMKSIIESVL